MTTDDKKKRTAKINKLAAKTKKWTDKFEQAYAHGQAHAANRTNQTRPKFTA
jgi:hypothetical protein